jgi:hypothetical protein
MHPKKRLKTATAIKRLPHLRSIAAPLPKLKSKPHFAAWINVTDRRPVR